MLRLTGMVAAVFTPMRPDGSLHLDPVGPIVDHLVGEGVGGLFACGSTGEGPSLSTEERLATAAAYVEAAAGRLPVVVHVGHTSLAEARTLAAHAQQIGASAVAAVAPYYFRPSSVENLVDCLAEITAAAPELPFYYYHIPGLTGVRLDMLELLRQAAERLPTLAGIKYTDATVDEFQTLLDFQDGRFDVLFGRDEMLLSGLAAGAGGAIGSTYNFAAPLYGRLIQAFRRGDLEVARRCQAQSVAMIRVLFRYGAMPAFKATMHLIGLDCGPPRLPKIPLTPDELTMLQSDLESIGFFTWARPQG